MISVPQGVERLDLFDMRYIPLVFGRVCYFSGHRTLIDTYNLAMRGL